MQTKEWGFSLALLFALAATASGRPREAWQPPAGSNLRGSQPARIIGPDTPHHYDGPVVPDIRRDESDQVAIGDDFLIGYTYYDYQHNGTIGKMIAKDTEGGVHFVWMKGYDAQQATRFVVYNALNIYGDGQLLYQPDEAPRVDMGGSRSGYTCMTLLPLDQRAMVFYHVIGPPAHERNYLGSAQGADFDRGFAAFYGSYPNPWPQDTLIWPHGAVSRNNITHLIATESSPAVWSRIAYWRGEPDRAFENWGWTDPPRNVDTTAVISPNAAASVTSDRVVMAWHHWRMVGGDGRNNDIRYVVSENGRDFDFQNGIRSLTRINPTIPDLAEFDMGEAYGDTFRAFCDLDIQFDPWGDDNLYAVFAGTGLWEEPVPDGDASTVDYPDYYTATYNFLWFWNGERDTITMVANGWYPNFSVGGNHHYPGGWRLNADRGSIAFNPDDPGTIYVVWVSFPQIEQWNPDYDPNDPNDQDPWFIYEGPAQDTSGAGYKAAEVMVSISTDFGVTWREPVNVTETIWEGDQAPEPGEMMSEGWASVAYLADDTLHIAYVRDTDAGGIPQGEGAATNSPWIYHRVPIDLLPLNDPVELPYDGFMFHNYLDYRPQIDAESVRRNPGVPAPGNQVTVTANVVGGGDFGLREVVLVYRVNGQNEQEVQMARVDGDVWGGAIPAQAAGATVWYRVRAINDAGLPAISPQENWWWGYVVRAAGNLTIRDIQERPDNWATDYSFYRGYEVTVTGVVTTPASFNRVYGAVAIQDATARWSGVFVRGVRQELDLGDRIRVTGTVFERDPQDPRKWEYLTYIQAAQVEVLGHGQQLPDPIQIEAIAELTYDGLCEQLEGCLVEAYNFEVDSLPWVDNRTYWPITDGGDVSGRFTTIGLTEQQITDMEIRTFARGTLITRMTGVFAENWYYAIAPRFPDDMGETRADEGQALTPYRFALNPAYPNPFNAVTTVSFTLPRSGFAALALFDLAGREVARLAEGELGAGQHVFTVDASDLSAGVYILRLEAGARTASRKVALVK